MIFSKFYGIVLNWANKKVAVYYLALLSFVESFILPYPPPDVLLAPMALKHKNKAYFYASITTIFSVLGGVVGYFIGLFAYDLIVPLLEKMHYLDKLELLKTWFASYGIWTLMIAGFSPIPYKLFTVLSGLLGLELLLFVLASALSRGARFFLVAVLVKKLGDACDIWLKKYIDYLGYGVLLLLFIIYLYINYV